jgi:hypothetical protein
LAHSLFPQEELFFEEQRKRSHEPSGWRVRLAAVPYSPSRPASTARLGQARRANKTTTTHDDRERPKLRFFIFFVFCGWRKRSQSTSSLLAPQPPSTGRVKHEPRIKLSTPRATGGGLGVA